MSYCYKYTNNFHVWNRSLARLKKQHVCIGMPLYFYRFHNKIHLLNLTHNHNMKMYAYRMISIVEAKALTKIQNITLIISIVEAKTCKLTRSHDQFSDITPVVELVWSWNQMKLRRKEKYWSIHSVRSRHSRWSCKWSIVVFEICNIAGCLLLRRHFTRRCFQNL